MAGDYEEFPRLWSHSVSRHACDCNYWPFDRASLCRWTGRLAWRRTASRHASANRRAWEAGTACRAPAPLRFQVRTGRGTRDMSGALSQSVTCVVLAVEAHSHKVLPPLYAAVEAGAGGATPLLLLPARHQADMWVPRDWRLRLSDPHTSYPAGRGT